MDGDYCWILQIKDTFSKYIWLRPLINKEAATVAAEMEPWFGDNGVPRKL
jgi:hypothetical protein